MKVSLEPSNLLVRRRVFPSWSIEIPWSFEETFVAEGAGYWHARDDCRSVSLTSVCFTETGRSVSANRILQELPPEPGEPVSELPGGLEGWGVMTAADPQAVASRTLSGLLARDGRVLITTITSDDMAWARRIWLSIRPHRPDAPTG